jgi:folate-binding protein YgfZ
LIDCERERTAELIKRLSLYKLRSKVDLTDLSDTYKVFVSRDTPSIPDAIQVADPRLKGLGYRLYTKSMPTELAHSNTCTHPVSETGSSRFAQDDGDLYRHSEEHRSVRIQKNPYSDLSNQYENHRISLGVPDGSRDIPIDKGIILEYGFDELQAIDWKKGCYMGQELTARTKHRGLVRKRLLPVKIKGESPLPFTPIFLGDEEIGEMRTSVPGCGLALLRLASIRNSLPELSCGNAQLTPYIPSWVQLPAAEN